MAAGFLFARILLLWLLSDLVGSLAVPQTNTFTYRKPWHGRKRQMNVYGNRRPLHYAMTLRETLNKQREKGVKDLVQTEARGKSQVPFYRVPSPPLLPKTFNPYRQRFNIAPKPNVSPSRHLQRGSQLQFQPRGFQLDSEEPFLYPSMPESAFNYGPSSSGNPGSMNVPGGEVEQPGSFIQSGLEEPQFPSNMMPIDTRRPLGIPTERQPTFTRTKLQPLSVPPGAPRPGIGPTGSWQNLVSKPFDAQQSSSSLSQELPWSWSTAGDLTQNSHKPMGTKPHLGSSLAGSHAPSLYSPGTYKPFETKGPMNPTHLGSKHIPSFNGAQHTQSHKPASAKLHSSTMGGHNPFLGSGFAGQQPAKGQSSSGHPGASSLHSLDATRQYDSNPAQTKWQSVSDMLGEGHFLGVGSLGQQYSNRPGEVKGQSGLPQFETQKPSLYSAAGAQTTYKHVPTKLQSASFDAAPRPFLDHFGPMRQSQLTQAAKLPSSSMNGGKTPWLSATDAHKRVETRLQSSFPPMGRKGSEELLVFSPADTIPQPSSSSIGPQSPFAGSAGEQQVEIQSGSTLAEVPSHSFFAGASRKTYRPTATKGESNQALIAVGRPVSSSGGKQQMLSSSTLMGPNHPFLGEVGAANQQDYNPVGAKGQMGSNPMRVKGPEGMMQQQTQSLMGPNNPFLSSLDAAHHAYRPAGTKGQSGAKGFGGDGQHQTVLGSTFPGAFNPFLNSNGVPKHQNYLPVETKIQQSSTQMGAKGQSSGGANQQQSMLSSASMGAENPFMGPVSSAQLETLRRVGTKIPSASSQFGAKGSGDAKQPRMQNYMQPNAKLQSSSTFMETGNPFSGSVGSGRQQTYLPVGTKTQPGFTLTRVKGPAITSGGAKQQQSLASSILMGTENPFMGSVSPTQLEAFRRVGPKMPSASNQLEPKGSGDAKQLQTQTYNAPSSKLQSSSTFMGTGYPLLDPVGPGWQRTHLPGGTKTQLASSRMSMKGPSSNSGGSKQQQPLASSILMGADNPFLGSSGAVNEPVYNPSGTKHPSNTIQIGTKGSGAAEQQQTISSSSLTGPDNPFLGSIGSAMQQSHSAFGAKTQLGANPFEAKGSGGAKRPQSFPSSILTGQDNPFLGSRSSNQQNFFNPSGTKDYSGSNPMGAKASGGSDQQMQTYLPPNVKVQSSPALMGAANSFLGAVDSAQQRNHRPGGTKVPLGFTPVGTKGSVDAEQLQMSTFGRGSTQMGKGSLFSVNSDTLKKHDHQPLDTAIQSGSAFKKPGSLGQQAYSPSTLAAKGSQGGQQQNLPVPDNPAGVKRPWSGPPMGPGGFLTSSGSGRQQQMMQHASKPFYGKPSGGRYANVETTQLGGAPLPTGSGQFNYHRHAPLHTRPQIPVPSQYGHPSHVPYQETGTEEIEPQQHFSSSQSNSRGRLYNRLPPVNNQNPSPSWHSIRIGLPEQNTNVDKVTGNGEYNIQEMQPYSRLLNRVNNPPVSGTAGFANPVQPPSFNRGPNVFNPANGGNQMGEPSGNMCHPSSLSPECQNNFRPAGPQFSKPGLLLV